MCFPLHGRTGVGKVGSGGSGWSGIADESTTPCCPYLLGFVRRSFRLVSLLVSLWNQASLRADQESPVWYLLE